MTSLGAGLLMFLVVFVGIFYWTFLKVCAHIDRLEARIVELEAARKGY